MKRLVAGVVAIAGIAYPFAVYYGLDNVGPRWLALPLAALWLARALTAPRTRPGALVLPAAALCFCVAMAWADSPALLRWYPVLVSLMCLALFGLSLRYGPPVIERLARLSDPALSIEGQRYTRRVTQVWVLFFAANATVAAALALWAPWRWWMIYNGAVSYGLIGLLLAGEWLIRPRKHSAGTRDVA
jgi:uncharacterized membrane protein